MSNVVLVTREGKKVVLSGSDECLYRSPRNPPNTGTKYTTGTDLYLHKARSGRVYFYLHIWSMWQGSEDRYEILDSEQAKQFLLKKAGGSGYDGLDPREMSRAEELFPGLFDEDA